MSILILSNPPLKHSIMYDKAVMQCNNTKSKYQYLHLQQLVFTPYMAAVLGMYIYLKV